MPPKKPQQPSKKTVETQKKKIIEDKTFGIKNKKGAKQQKFIQQVEKQVIQGNKSARELEAIRKEKQEKKEAKKKEFDELAELFKPVAQLQKVSAGVDPKSVLCVFFKQGLCRKGDKCKFSHDLTIQRKAEKRNLYEDDPKNSDRMENWDQEKLEDVVAKKHGDSNKGLPPTTIICKFFLDAVEISKYGWFWECPNGPSCHYRHALPPGFILKKDQKKMEEQQEVISLEELIESERQSLGMELTKVTLESFIAWKKRKRSEKIVQDQVAKARRRSDFKLGRTVGISGREMFEFNPDFAKEQEEDEEGDVFDILLREKEDEGCDGPIYDVDISAFAFSNCDEAELENAPKGDEIHSNAIAIDEELFNDSDLDEELGKLAVEE